jgi:hypothetical protein
MVQAAARRVCARMEAKDRPGPMTTIACAALFALWLLVTAVCQLQGRIPDALRRLDVFSLIPRWTFFAPNPGVLDYHLLVRDRHVDGSLSAFREVRLGARRSLLGALWNPDKRNQKMLSDAVHSLPILRQELSEKGMKTTLPYIAILNRVCAGQPPPLTVARQFAIVATGGSSPITEPHVLFLSELHRWR